MDKKEGNKGDPKKWDTAPVTLDSEARLQNEAPQPKPRGGRCGADRRRRNWQKLSICTYNTRTMSHQDDLDRLLDQLNDIDWNVVGLCETKKRGEGLTELPCGSWMFDVGKTEDRPDAKGLAFLVNKSFKDFIVSLMSHLTKVLLRIIMARMRKSLRPEISQLQFGFVPDKSTRNAIFTLSMLAERCIEMQKDLYLCYIDYSKAFDKVRHEKLFNILEHLDIDGKDLRVIRIYTGIRVLLYE